MLYHSLQFTVLRGGGTAAETIHWNIIHKTLVNIFNFLWIVSIDFQLKGVSPPNKYKLFKPTPEKNAEMDT